MNKSKVDSIFSENSNTEFSNGKEIPQFSFNETVASVFDDMIARSIPGYEEVQKLTELLCLKLEFKKEDIIYDLGCSTGTTLVRIAETLRNSSLELPKMIGIDNSKPMLIKLEEKIKAHDLVNDIQGINNSIIDLKLERSKLIISHYTLQFINPDLRLEILKKISSSLLKGGYFIFSEKVKHESEEIEALVTDSYYDYKAKKAIQKQKL